VLFDSRTTAVGYAANIKVPQPVLMSFVESFTIVGLKCLPGELSVVQHERQTGILSFKICTAGDGMVRSTMVLP
jgi:hypothetical protein